MWAVLLSGHMALARRFARRSTTGEARAVSTPENRRSPGYTLTMLPVDQERHTPPLPIPPNRVKLYCAVAIGLVFWAVGYVFLVSKVLATAIFWMSYYAVDYSSGFVRRGLAGAIVSAFPAEYYFPMSYTMMWGAVVLYCIGLAAVAWRILDRGRLSERRVMICLLIPVLPFAITFALFGPRPELYAAGFLLIFATALTRVGSIRGRLGSSAGFGLAIAALGLFHEAIPLEFALGAVLAITVLSTGMKPATRALCVSLAVLPGLFVTAAVAVFGRRDVASELCERVPHGFIRDPWGVPGDRITDYLMGRYNSVSDYHDWVCERVIPFFGADFSAGVHTVMRLGLPILAASFLHGLIVCALTLWLINFFTRVPFREFIRNVRGGLWLPILAAGFMVPIFASGTDWIRWWTVILINIAGVYLVFASGRTEIETPVTRRDVTWFIVVLVLLALIPLSAVNTYYTGWVSL